jgi:glycosyltransferase involved in cell wall biosynthesis
MLGGAQTLCPAGIDYVPESSHPPTNAGWVLVGLPLAARRAGVDLIHAPAYVAPFWSPVPVVLTVHDVSYARHPEWFPYRRDALRRAYYRRSALSASAVITDSAFSAAEITAAYDIPPTRVVVIPLGVSPELVTGRAAPLPAGVAPPYVLHVGDLHERRNLHMAVRALLRARQDAGLRGLRLVLAGVDRGIGSDLLRLAREAGSPDAVMMLGPVDEDVLRGLYRGAAGLVYPSRYEGFGLPLVEAMACGIPVLASRAASIPEVVGDAAILLNPDAESAWADALVRILTDQPLAVQLGAAGQQRTRSLTWDETARRTQEVYHRAVTAHGALPL